MCIPSRSFCLLSKDECLWVNPLGTPVLDILTLQLQLKIISSPLELNCRICLLLNILREVDQIILEIFLELCILLNILEKRFGSAYSVNAGYIIMGAIDFLGVQNDCIFMNIFNPEIFVNNLAIFFIRWPIKMIRSLMVHTGRICAYRAPPIR